MDDLAQQGEIARSATIVSVGNVLSRLMGLAREAVIAGVFGASGAVSAYKAASQVPLTLYEMLVGGMVSSALVPTFSQYARAERRNELWRIASLLFTLAALTLGLVVLLLELGAPLVSRALVQFDAPLQAVTTRLLRLTVLGVFFLGLSGVATALCQALQRFALPAFTTAVFNTSIVVAALILGPRWVTEVKHPTVEDIWAGDLVAGRLIRQPDGTLRAAELIVAPRSMLKRAALGQVIQVAENTIVIEQDGKQFRASIDAQTSLSVTRRRVEALAIGLVIGAALQVILQLPALRDVRFHLAFDLGHPILHQILRLYAPVVLSLVVASFGVVLDRNLASRTGEASISWMHFATTLIQFPLGLISMAISTAILPALSRQAAAEETQPAHVRSSEDFRATLASGLRLVLVLTVPAVVGLLVLAHPIVALLFQHGEFDAVDTAQTALALRYYLIGLLSAAVDQPLVFAFYARKDTLRPALVGILGVGFYLFVALPTLRPLGMIGLILANGAQLAGHAAVMIWLFQRRIGRLRGYGIGQTLGTSLVASAAMGGAIYGIVWGVDSLWPAGEVARRALTVVAGGGIGLAVYLALCSLLRVRELDLLRMLAQRIVRRVLPHSPAEDTGSG